MMQSPLLTVYLLLISVSLPSLVGRRVFICMLWRAMVVALAVLTSVLFNTDPRPKRYSVRYLSTLGYLDVFGLGQTNLYSKQAVATFVPSSRQTVWPVQLWIHPTLNDDDCTRNSQLSVYCPDVDSTLSLQTSVYSKNVLLNPAVCIYKWIKNIYVVAFFRERLPVRSLRMLIMRWFVCFLN